MGDIDGLAAGIEAVGLLQPIGITPDLRLIFGERRLRAFELLNEKLGDSYAEIPVRQIDIGSIIDGEFHENEDRKDLTPEERVHVGRSIEAELGSRQGQRTDGALVENFPQVEAGAKTREVAATKAGFGNDRTYRQAREIVEAAEAEPERFGGLVADMNRTGRVNGPYKRLKVARQAELIRREPPPLRPHEIADLVLIRMEEMPPD
jgi:ParB family chromosome partitioning protein